MDAIVLYFQLTSNFPSWTFSTQSVCFALRRKALQPSRISRFQTDSVRPPLDVNGNPRWQYENRRRFLPQRAVRAKNHRVQFDAITHRDHHIDGDKNISKAAARSLR